MDDFKCPRCHQPLGHSQKLDEPPVPDPCRNPACTGEGSDDERDDQNRNNSYT